MNSVMNIIGNTLSNTILIIEILLFFRALFSWLPAMNSSRAGRFVYNLTEPTLIPFRRLVDNSSVVRNSIIDIAFITAVLVLEVIRRFIINIF